MLAALLLVPRAGYAQGARPPADALEEAQRLDPDTEFLYGQRRFDAAIPPAERVLALLEKAGMALGEEHPDVVTWLNNLPFRSEHPDVVTLLNNLAFLYDTKGDYASAEPLYQRALGILEKTLVSEHPDVANSLNHLAALYETIGDYASAERLYQRARRILEKALGSEHPRVATLLNNLAGLYRTKGDYVSAEPLYQQARQILETALGSEHPQVAISLNNLAWLHWNKGDYASAEPLYEQARQILETTLGSGHIDVASVLGNLAALRQALGDAPGALLMTEQAAKILDRNAAIVLTTGGDEERRAYMATLQRRTDYTVSLHVQFASTSEMARRLALTTLLRRKGRVLDAMTHSLVALRRRANPADLALLDELIRVSAELSTLTWRGPEPRRSGQSAQDYANGQLAQYHANLARLDAERQTLETEIVDRSPEVKAEFFTFTLADVQKAVPEGAALVELSRYKPFNPRGSLAANTRWGKARYVAYVLWHSGDIAWADLGEAAPIEDAAERLLSALRLQASDPRPAARALDALVMQPIRGLLGSTREILLSPDDALNLVPFGALLDEENHYLIERYAVTYLPGGRDLLRLRTTAQQREGAVVIAAPDYDHTAGLANQLAKGSISSSEEQAPGHFAPLAAAATEGKAVSQELAGARLLLGQEATESAVKALRGPLVLHIATHGFFAPSQEPPEHPPAFLDAGSRGARGVSGFPGRVGNPLLRSGLALAGANRKATGDDNGILTAMEASQLDLNGTKLVVLSACQTGVGETTSGDGVYGLRRAFVMSGAETQILSLWDVDDASTRELMEGYYAQLKAGGGRSESMRQAQLAMLAAPERSHPHYWASFIVSGNGATLGGRPVKPPFGLVPPPVPPSARGCRCEVGPHPPTGVAGGYTAALLAAFTLALRRRRGAHHEQRLRVAQRRAQSTRSGPTTTPARVAPVAQRS